MMLAVTDEEARELVAVLEANLRDLQAELVHTDDRAYRSDLRDRYDHLERLLTRLKQTSPTDEAYV